MEFVANRKKLEQAITNVSKAVNSKSPIRILEGIRLTLTKEGLNIKGSDGEITINCFIPANAGENQYIVVKKEGEALLGTRYLSEIVRNLDAETITFEMFDPGIMKIKDRKAEFSIHTLPLEEYPNVDLDRIGETITLPSTQLKEIIKQTIFAVSTKDARPILMGVSFHAKDKLLECAATDTYRLSRKIVTIKENVEFETIIPAKSLNILQTILADDKEVLINIATKNITFIQEDLILSSKYINGPFPNVAKLLPNSFDYTLSMKAPALISAIERAALLSEVRNCAVKLALSPDNIEISSSNQQVGYVKEHIENGIFVGQPFTISFNSQFVIDALKAIDKDEIIIYFAGDMRPFVIKNERDDSLTQLILPVRS